MMGNYLVQPNNYLFDSKCCVCVGGGWGGGGGGGG